MASTVEFILNLKENLSAKLKTIGIENEKQLSTWSAVQKQVESANDTMDKMGRSIGSLRQRIDSLKAQKEWIPASNHAAIRAANHEIRDLEKEIDKLNNINGGKLSKWAGQIKDMIPGAVNPLSVAILGIGKAINVGMDAEMQKTNLQTLFQGNTAAAEAMYKKIADYGMKTPYEKTELIEGQKTMMSFGLSSEFAFSKLKQIGDIALGDKEKMKSLSLAFSQATSAGKLQGQDLLQMINAGFNPLQVISERTGVSMEKMKDRMSKGKISAAELSQAFEWATDKQGLFYQGAEKASQTLKGKISNLMDNLAEMAISLYDNVLSPIVKPIADLAVTVFGWVNTGLTSLISGFQRANPVLLTFAGIVGAITLAVIAYNVWQKITATWTTIVTFFKYGEAAAWWAATAPMLLTIAIIAAIIAAIAAVVAVIIYCVKHVTGWGQTWKNITTYMGLAFELFKASLVLTWLGIKNTFMDGFSVIAKGWYKLQSLWDKNSASAGLSKLEAQRNERLQELAAAKGKTDELRKQMSTMTVWALKTDGTSLKQYLGSVKNKVTSGLGIPTPGTGGGGSGGEGNNMPGGKSAANSIATGGSRNTTINITMGKMIESIVFNGGLKENSGDMERQVEEALMRVLYAAQSAG